MPAPFEHSDLSTLLGSWPVTPNNGLLPRTLKTRASILSILRETTTGFDVAGRSFDLWVDLGATPPTKYTVALTGSANLTLDQIITQINAVTPQDVAFRDNGFLRLESPNIGEDSYLRIETNPISTPTDVLYNLGLFAGTESKGGSLQSATSFDPDRQVALPGQLSWSEGEDLDARVFNRMSFQLGVNSDRMSGLLDRKRMAVRKEWEGNPINSPNGIELSDTVYVGDSSSIVELEKLFAVLDENGSEYTKEVNTVSGSDSTTEFTVDSESGQQRVISTTAIFSASDDVNDVYVRPLDLAAPGVPLNDQVLKITKFVSSTEVIIAPIDPATGTVIPIDQTNRSIQRVIVEVKKCRVAGAYNDSSGGRTRVEGVNEEKVASIAVERIEKNNRIVVLKAGAFSGFSTDGVVLGDRVVWSSFGSDNPYSNNGVYRIAGIIDEETVELVSEDWGPVYLNPDVSVGIGTIQVTTDGKFYESPFLEFEANGAEPSASDNIRLLYMGMSSFREASDDPALFLGGGVKYAQETDFDTQRALLYIIGPSITSINEYLYSDRRLSLEGLYYWMEHEHYPIDTEVSGRHKDIRPDNIEFWDTATGNNLIMYTGGEADSVIKASLGEAGYADRDKWRLFADGDMWLNNRLGVGTPYDRSLVEGLELNEGYEAAFMMPTDKTSSATAGAYGQADLPLTTYFYLVTAFDLDGNESGRAAESSATSVGGTRNILVQWDEFPGAANYRVYRGSSSGAENQYVAIGNGRTSFVDHGGISWTGGTPPAQYGFHSLAWATKIDSKVGTSWVGDNLSIGGALTGAKLGIKLSHGDTELLAAYSPGGASTYSLPDDGLGASLWQVELGNNSDSTSGFIQRENYYRWDGPVWSGNWVFDHSIEHRRETINWKDSSGNFKMVYATDEGFLQIGSSPYYAEYPDYPLHIRFARGTGLHAIALQTNESWPVENVYMGIQATDKFYITNDSGRAFVQSTNNGYTSINARSINDTIYGQLEVHLDTLDYGGVIFETSAGGASAGNFLHFRLANTTTSAAVADMSWLGGLFWQSSYDGGTFHAPSYANAAIWALQAGASASSNLGGHLAFWTTPSGSNSRLWRYTMADDGDLYCHDNGIMLRGFTNTTTKDRAHGLQWYSTFGSRPADGPALFGNSGGALGTRGGGPGNENAVMWWDYNDVSIKHAVVPPSPLNEFRIDGIAAGPNLESSMNILKYNVHDVGPTSTSAGSEDVHALAFDGDDIYAFGEDTGADPDGFSIARLHLELDGTLTLVNGQAYYDTTHNFGTNPSSTIRAGRYIFCLYSTLDGFIVAKLRIETSGLPTLVSSLNLGTVLQPIAGVHFDGSYLYAAKVYSGNIYVYKINPQLGGDSAPTVTQSLTTAAAGEEANLYAFSRLCAGKSYLYLATNTSVAATIKLRAVNAAFRTSNAMSLTYTVDAATDRDTAGDSNDYGICTDGGNVWLAYMATGTNWTIKKFRSGPLTLEVTNALADDMGDVKGVAVDDRYLYVFGLTGGTFFDKWTLAPKELGVSVPLSERLYSGAHPHVDESSIFTSSYNSTSVGRSWKPR